MTYLAEIEGLNRRIKALRDAIGILRARLHTCRYGYVRKKRNGAHAYLEDQIEIAMKQIYIIRRGYISCQDLSPASPQTPHRVTESVNNRNL